MVDLYREMADGWQVHQILEAVDLALADPDHPPSRFGDEIRFEKVVTGKLVRVQVRVDLDPPEIWNAYPVDGDR